MLRWYDLRHMCTTILLARGLDAREIMEILGHSQINLTMNTYAHVMPSRLREAAMQLDGALRPPTPREFPQDSRKNGKSPAD